MQLLLCIAFNVIVSNSDYRPVVSKHGIIRHNELEARWNEVAVNLRDLTVFYSRSAKYNKNFVRTVSVLAEIQTEYLPNTKQKS
jgi:hypothetical protein